MEIQFYGAAREVTGSCHIVRVNGRTIVLDCGLFQGRRADVTRKNSFLPPEVRAADAVILSHAHIDHAGRLPFLVREGYKGPIHVTTATRDLCEVMLADAAHIQEKDAEFLARRNRSAVEPLYTQRDVVRTIELMKPQRYAKPFEVLPGVTATFVDAGHILGSASVILDVVSGSESRRLVFSGDIGRAGLPIIRDPVAPEGANVVIMESTYGNRDHADTNGGKEALARVIRETAARGGRVLIPAFAVGRAQELVYDLHELTRDRPIPEVPIYIDSPLATRATDVFARNTTIFDTDEPFIRKQVGNLDELFRFPQLRYTDSVEESKRLDTQGGPSVIIAASGMAESGRILHHLLHGASDPRNTILVVGFMAEHTLGRRIVDRAPLLKVFGEEVPLRAHVEVISGYSAHGDRRELRAWIDAVRSTSRALSDVYLVHGEVAAQGEFSTSLAAAGYRVHCPEPGKHVTW